MRPWPLLVPWVAACAGDDDVAVAMERGLRTGQTALAVALVADELVVHLWETPDLELRHGPVNCCPCKTRQGDVDGDFTVRLDYHPTGCTADSALVPATLAGYAMQWGSPDGTHVELHELELGAHVVPVTGHLGGDVDRDTAVVTVAGPLQVDGVPHRVDLVVGNQGVVTLDGVVRVDDDRIRFDGVRLEYDRIATPCPTPTAGTLTLDDPEDDVVIDLADPGLGLVTVTRGNRVSEDVSWCAFRSDLL